MKIYPFQFSPSEYSLADLGWALTRYGAMDADMRLRDCREAQLDGADCKALHEDLLQPWQPTRENAPHLCRDRKLDGRQQQGAIPVTVG